MKSSFLQVSFLNPLVVFVVVFVNVGVVTFMMRLTITPKVDVDHAHRKTLLADLPMNSSSLTSLQNQTSVSTGVSPMPREFQVSDLLSPRTYIPWNQMNRTPPCIIDHRGPDWDPMNAFIQRQPSSEGILFIKIEKAASSTLAGVAARISHAIANLTKPTISDPNGTITARPICRVRLAHLWSKKTDRYDTRNHEQSFLFTFLKNPTKRILSEFFFFFVDIQNLTIPTDVNVVDYVKRSGNSQLVKLSDSHAKRKLMKLDKAGIAELVQKALDELDFIGLVERMDESLVLLQLLLGLRPSDVLAQSAKQSGGYVATNKKICMTTPKHVLSPVVQSFVDSEEWKNLNLGDEMLYAAVNASLDRSIDTIGRPLFEDALAKFRQAKEKANRECPPPPDVCSSDGTYVGRTEKTECYWDDAGCGYKCLDDIFQDEPFPSLLSTPIDDAQVNY